MSHAHCHSRDGPNSTLTRQNKLRFIVTGLGGTMVIGTRTYIH
jgi:hypothetical protein